MGWELALRGTAAVPKVGSLDPVLPVTASV